MTARSITVSMKWRLGVTWALAVLLWVGITAAAPDLNDQLIQASGHGNLELVKSLLAHGAYINAKDQQGWTLLIAAAAEGGIEVSKLLLDKSADINGKGKSGRTALMWATKKGRLDVVEVLLDRKADVDAKD